MTKELEDEIFEENQLRLSQEVFLSFYYEELIICRPKLPKWSSRS
jgi:hypothetical protein